VTSEAGRLTVAAVGATGVVLTVGAGAATTFSAALSALVVAGVTGGLMAGAGVGETTGATLIGSLTSLTVAADFG
jgi:hypothetical protein